MSAKCRPEQVQQTEQAYSITSSARASSVGGTVDAECLGSLEIDDQLEFGRKLHGKIRRRGALQSSIHVLGRVAVCIDDACSVTDQAASSAYSR